MAEYLSPGVYVEEKSSGVKPIEGVGTSTGAFVGFAERGPVGKAELIPNWTKFVNIYGSFTENAFLAYAVYQFFAEGGTRCYVVRTCHYSDITDPLSKTTAAARGTMNDDAGGESLKFMALDEGTWCNKKISIEAKDPTDKTKEFKLVVKFNGNEQESFDDLTIKDVSEKVNSKYIKVETVGTNAPTKGTTVILDDGSNGDTIKSAVDFEGDESAGNGLHAFDVIDDINIVAMPDIAGDRDAIIKGFSYCQNRGDCFFIADSPLGLGPTQVKDFKEAQGKYTRRKLRLIHHSQLSIIPGCV